MTLKEVLEKSTNFFKEKKIETARLDAEILLAKALNLKRIDLYLQFEKKLNEQELNLCRELVKRRSGGEPVAYILEEKEFFKLKFKVDRRVLIPRPETEILVEEIINIFANKDKVNILDLGCGSGCVGIALLANLKEARCTFVDLSKEALAVCEENLLKNNLKNLAELVFSDVQKFAADKDYDIIVANPPYISKDDENIQAEVREFEPNIALFSKQKGLADIFAWSAMTEKFLRPGGVMGFEFGATQKENVVKHFESLQKFESIKTLKDYSGFDRHIIAQKKL